MPEEIWAAKDTPVHKQVNYLHNEKDIIGAITDSYVVDSQGEIITDESRVADIRDIVSKAVLWVYWDNEELKARAEDILKKIESKEFFVSMECLFKEFDYLFSKGDTSSIITRNKDTAFLTKHLKYFGGTGEYDGGRISRVIRNFTFSGKGIVPNPANDRSVIFFNSKTDNETKLIQSKSETIMDEAIKAELEKAKSDLLKAQEELEKIKSAEAEKVAAEVAEIKAKNDELTKQLANMTSMAEDMKKKMDEMEKESCSKMEEAEAKIKALEAEKVTAARKAQLVSVNVDEAKADELCATWASANDDQFKAVVELCAKAKKAAPEDIVKTEKSEAFDLDGLDKSDNVDPNKIVADADQTNTDAEKALAAKLAKIFKLNSK